MRKQPWLFELKRGLSQAARRCLGVCLLVLGATLLPPLLSPPLTARDQDDDLAEVEKASQNPLLWDHFGQLTGRMPKDRFREGDSSYDPPEQIRERHTRRLIEGFLQRVRKQSREFAACGQELADMERKNSTLDGEDLDLLLRRTERSAKDLRGTLSQVYHPLLDLRNENRVRIESPTLQELSRSVLETYRSVYGSVFGGSETVTVEQLRGESMLDSLARVQKMAKTLRRTEPLAQVLPFINTPALCMDVSSIWFQHSANLPLCGGGY